MESFRFCTRISGFFLPDCKWQHDMTTEVSSSKNQIMTDPLFPALPLKAVLTFEV